MKHRKGGAAVPFAGNRKRKGGAAMPFAGSRKGCSLGKMAIAHLMSKIMKKKASGRRRK